MNLCIVCMVDLLSHRHVVYMMLALVERLQVVVVHSAEYL